MVGISDRADGGGRVSDSDLSDLVLVVALSMSVVGSLVITTVVVVTAGVVVGVLIVSSSDVVSQGRGGQDQKSSTELHCEKRFRDINEGVVVSECKQ